GITTDSNGNPASGGAWAMNNWWGTDASCQYEGTTAGCIYWGVDKNWFSGSSWARPILNADTAVSTTTVSTCSYQSGSYNVMIQAGVADIIDNFEVTGFCSSRNPGSTGPSTDVMIAYGGTGNYGSGMLFEENLYIHGWTTTSTAGQSNSTIACTILGGGAGGLQTLDHIVIDGADSDPQVCSWATFPSFYHFRDSIIRYTTQGVGNWCHDVHDNIFEHFYNPIWPTHGNVLECNDDSPGSAVNQPQNTPNVVYNNIVRHDDAGFNTGNPRFWFCPESVPEYWFNNLQYDLAKNATQNWDYAGPSGYSCSNAGGQYMFNNTIVGAAQPCYLPTISHGGQYLTVYDEHLIGTSFDSGSTACTGVSSPTNVSVSFATAVTEGYLTTGGTGGSGYTCANESTTPCSPIAATNSTVGTGANHMAYCNALASFTSEPAISTDAANACAFGTSDACSYNLSNHTMNCPAQALVARPTSTAWDAGAYQFSGTVAQAPAAPTGLTATVQ
ncbi:MAG: hypothetical protein KGL02_09035, partial [Acidobacteriota bacterium]|nr:hypothetical protein [Acidobacteriota bacterium]